MKPNHHHNHFHLELTVILFLYSEVFETNFDGICTNLPAEVLYYPEISSSHNQETGITMDMEQRQAISCHGKARSAKDSLEDLIPTNNTNNTTATTIVG